MSLWRNLQLQLKLVTLSSNYRISMIFELQHIKYLIFWREIWTTHINKVSKRPNNIDLGKLSLTRSLFAIKFAKLFENNIVIANVDEWSMNYKSSDCYSWRKRRSNGDLRALPFKGSISIILWIFSNGTYFLAIIQNTVNSSILCQYLQIIEDWINKTLAFKDKRIVFLLDNWPIHRSKQAANTMKRSKMDFMFLPGYSPQLAPIELSFNTFKKRLYRDWRSELTNLNDIGAFDRIRTWITLFTRTEIKSYFSIFFRQVKFYLHNSIE